MDKAYVEGGGSSIEMRKTLDAAVTAKQETDAKLTQYYIKIEEYRKEATVLREHVGNVLIFELFVLH